MRVGTSYKNDIDKAFGEDHPHACGDKSESVYLRDNEAGSSPCVWGQVLSTVLTAMSNWIIPMRVGTSGR